MTPRFKRVRQVVYATALLSAASLAEAQPAATSFENLPLVVRQQDTLTVIDTDGREVTGRLSALSSSSLTLLVDGRAREFSPESVRAIRQRRSDSLANGAWIGALVGGGSAAVAVLAATASCGGGCDWEPEWVPIAAIGVYGAAGAGLGVGVDALIRRQHVIYSAAANESSTRLTPIVQRDRKGVALSIGF